MVSVQNNFKSRVGSLDMVIDKFKSTRRNRERLKLI